MGLEWVYYVLASLIAGMLTIGVSMYSWQQRSQPGAKMIAYLSAAASLWAFGNVIQVTFIDMNAMIFWDNLKTMGIITIPLTWIALSLEYSGYKKILTRKFWVVIFLEPSFSAILTWTNHLHGLVYTNPRINTAGPFPHLEYDLGSMMLVDNIYGYSLIAIGAAFFIWNQVHRSKFYTLQTLGILGAMIPPLLSHIIWISGILEFPAIDLTPIFFSISSVFFAWAVLRYGLLGILPLALDTVVRSTNVAIIVLDVDNKVVHINPAMEQLVNQETFDIHSIVLDELLDEWTELKNIVHNREYGRKVIKRQVKTKCYYFDAHVSALNDKNSSLVGRLISLHDITDLRLVQEELLAYTSELSARNEELDAYGHTVAHGLKNVLQMMMNQSGLLMISHASMSNKKIQDSLRQIEGAALKMSDIIENLMFLGGLRNEPITLEPLEMTSIINEVMNRLTLLRETHQVETILPKFWPSAIGYAPWIEEVWDNYMSNAIKYGGSPCRVELGADEMDDGMILFWIIDNGEGISEEKRQEIFSPFISSHTNESQGHGLGLSIVKRIVTKLGGTVGVEVNAEGGCKFTFSLPGAKKYEFLLTNN